MSPKPLRALLPAYGCPNLLAAVIAAEAKPEFVDIDTGTLSMSASSLRMELQHDGCLIVWVDMFGVPTAEAVEPALRDHLIHDLAQSYAPYLPGWKAVASHTVVSFGRAKPLALTAGGALLTAPVPLADPAADEARGSMGSLHCAKLMLRAAIYNQCLGRLPYGILRALPTGVGNTRFTPLEHIRTLGGDMGRVVFELWRELERQLADVEASTRAMCDLVERVGLPLHPLVTQGTVKCLWRVPVHHPSEAAAEFFAGEAASLGVSRLYGRSLPEFSGIPADEARVRWPNAWNFARRLTTLPTHGRLDAAQISRLGTLLKASRDVG
jgi:dTDP-4-amino-4,6-dideoxygalactose transaminase